MSQLRGQAASARRVSDQQSLNAQGSSTAGSYSVWSVCDVLSRQAAGGCLFFLPAQHQENSHSPQAIS